MRNYWGQVYMGPLRAVHPSRPRMWPIMGDVGPLRAIQAQCINESKEQIEYGFCGVPQRSRTKKCYRKPRSTEKRRAQVCTI